MKLGFGVELVWLRRRVAQAVSAWTPAELFSATDEGFAFDLIDLSGANTLSDQTGTTPGAGDPLGYLPGISPNAKTATQSVSTERPINRALTSTERADLLAYADYVRGV